MLRVHRPPGPRIRASHISHYLVITCRPPRDHPVPPTRDRGAFCRAALVRARSRAAAARGRNSNGGRGTAGSRRGAAPRPVAAFGVEVRRVPGRGAGCGDGPDPRRPTTANPLLPRPALTDVMVKLMYTRTAQTDTQKQRFVLNCLCTTNARADSRRFTLAAHAHPPLTPAEPIDMQGRGGGAPALAGAPSERVRQSASRGRPRRAAARGLPPSARGLPPSRRARLRAAQPAHAGACSASKSSIRA
jgi:hypothetical protein